jgi:hypothetical protein
VIQFEGRGAIISGAGSGLDRTDAQAHMRQFSRGSRRPAGSGCVPNGGHMHVFDTA